MSMSAETGFTSSDTVLAKLVSAEVHLTSHNSDPDIAQQRSQTAKPGLPGSPKPPMQLSCKRILMSMSAETAWAGSGTVLAKPVSGKSVFAELHLRNTTLRKHHFPRTPLSPSVHNPDPGPARAPPKVPRIGLGIGLCRAIAVHTGFPEW